MEEPTPSYKIILVGDSSVGKTCIFSKYIKNQYPKNVEPTLGQEFKTKPITLPDGKLVKANLWDTAGQEKYRSLMATNYRKAVGAILVYDITQTPSFTNLQQWLQDIKLQAEPDVVITLIGNKTDLESSRMVSTEQGQNFAKQNNLSFFETSALNGANLGQIFESHLLEITNKKKQAQQLPQGTQPVAISNNTQKQPSSVQNQPSREMGESGCKC
ncbi:Rab-family small GTPase (macronuclear) [Tetrahymena thermophila SB210]|uniref:Rab-family small GTPase n=2 Tax=Tetrahymena thermophila TaxID=5911 RepID=Q22BI9_TETTS|nr:Rab-family small GTPase [Tetrahymena thermophila SB210]EAR82677.1 Rab-family small GTPase [Tetrahymena thermophila SB210]BAJ21287.1 Rab-family small GTPase Rab11G [Tetrahymena thermophila]|eukprot:XP_001030340.1 Rab-family small GTPase [Tetrahymena thermophila SB210]